MQSEHRVVLTKNHVLLVNDTPVEEVVDELGQGGILTGEMSEFIRKQPERDVHVHCLRHSPGEVLKLSTRSVMHC